jgi:hypothetical protein
VSPRRDVSRDRIEELLRAIGSSFRHPGRLYLSGGDSLVWRGLRDFTHDVDVSYEIDSKHHDAWLRTIRELKDRLDVNIEEAHPGDFVPLPPGSADRAEAVGRYGQLEVYLLDPYAVALGTLGRGHAQDLVDVRAMLDAGVIAEDALRRHFEAVLPEYERRSFRADPEHFRAMLDSVLPPGT